MNEQGPKGPLWGPSAKDSGEGKPRPAETRHGESGVMPAGPGGEGPWGLLGTALWTILIGVAFVGSGVLSGMFFFGYKALSGEPASDAMFQQMSRDGDLLWLSVLIQVFLCGLVLLSAVVLRKGYSAREYLAFYSPGVRGYAPWVVLLVVYNSVSEYLMHVLQIPTPQWMFDVFASADCMICLLVAVVFLSPPLEELIFRGFVFRGVQTRLGVFWAVVLASIPWTLLHMQYPGVYHMGMIMGLGIIFALARWRTGSIYVPIVMHVINNGAAAVQMFFFG